MDFLFCLLLGALLVSLAAVVSALEPNDVTCITPLWMIEVGYTLEIVPLIVKVRDSE